MIRALRRMAPLLMALLAALSPPSARAAGPLSSPAPNPDTLTAQEREVLLLANELARRHSEAVEKWLSSNEVAEDRLFDYLHYPIAHTDPPKFNTDWDQLTDRDVRPLEEATLSKSNALVYAVLVDLNGYVASHNQRYSQPLTHDRSVDFVNNQTKRFLNNHVETWPPATRGVPPPALRWGHRGVPGGRGGAGEGARPPLRRGADRVPARRPVSRPGSFEKGPGAKEKEKGADACPGRRPSLCDR